MASMKIAAIVLMVAGVLGLIYGGFTYTSDRHETDLGLFEVSVTEKETVNVPIWAGVAAIAVGGIMLVMAGKKT